MAEKSYPSGTMLVYGVAIGSAIARGNVSTEELLALRSHAKSIVDAQGDLTAALAALDQEIAKRGGPVGAKISEAASAAPGERFVVQIVGLPIPAAAKQNIENTINETVKTAIARLDTGGDLVMTPLSKIKSFGGGLGGATAGIWIRPEKDV
jgi:hypothetical protein